jgi:acyl-homoserine-lactone acylase
MNPAKRLAALVGLALVSIAPAAPSLSAAAATRFGGGEILWDTFGVPHVYARTEAGIFYGFGYAQAQSHGNLLLHIYGEAHAKAAEYWGPSYEKGDRWLIANDVPERSLAW